MAVRRSAPPKKKAFVPPAPATPPVLPAAGKIDLASLIDRVKGYINPFTVIIGIAVVLAIAILSIRACGSDTENRKLVTFYQERIKRYPDDPKHHYDLSDLYRKMGKLKDSDNEYDIAERIKRRQDDKDRRREEERLNKLIGNAPKQKTPDEVDTDKRKRLEDTEKEKERRKKLEEDAKKNDTAKRKLAADKLTREARSFIDKGNAGEARKKLNEALKQDDRNPGIYALLGELDLAAGDYDSAGKMSRKALELDPDNSDAHYTLGEVDRNLGLDDEAIDEYKKAAASNPNNFDAWLKLGNMYFRKAQYTKAMDMYQNALKLQPKHANALYNLGNTYKQLGRSSDALTAYLKAVENSGKDTRIQYAANNQTGNVYYSSGSYEEAHNAYRKALAARETPEIFISLGSSLEALKRTDEARTYYKKSIDAKPNFDGYFYLGRLLYNEKNYANALACFINAGAINPKDANVKMMEGRTHLRMGERDKAKIALERSIALDSDNANAYIDLAEVYRAEKNYQKAVEICKTAIRYQPDSLAAHNNLGLIYIDARDLENAAATFKNAIQLNPAYSETHFNLAKVYNMQQKNYDEAIDELNRVIKINKNYLAESYELLGIIYYDIKQDKEKALFNYQKVLEIDPNYNNKAEVQKIIGRLKAGK
ncbi:MAG: tetratricopeptide repeat protein [Spirochaetes bacterium]|nr:tetratricopeptide repeat protein [Spirochaetota bacterium]